MRLLLGFFVSVTVLGCQESNQSMTRHSPPAQSRREPPVMVMDSVEAAFSPDGRWLLTRYIDFHGHPNSRAPQEWLRVKLWDVSTGKVVKTFPGLNLEWEPPLLAFLLDGKRAFSAGTAWWRIFDVPSGEVLREFNGVAEGVPFFFHPLDVSGDGQRLLTYGSGGKGKGLALWDVATEKVIKKIATNYEIIGGRLSQDGKLTLAEGSRPEGNETGRNIISMQLWAFDKDTPVLLLEPQDKKLCCLPVAFSPDGKRFVTSSDTSTVNPLLVWDVGTGKKIREIGSSRGLLNVAFTAQGEELLLFGDGYLKRIAMADGKDIRSIQVVKPPHTADNYPRSVAFSHNGNVAFVARGWLSNTGERMIFSLYDTVRGKLLREWKAPP
jgi:WD40 repeat protein